MHSEKLEKNKDENFVFFRPSYIEEENKNRSIDIDIVVVVVIENIHCPCIWTGKKIVQ